jgi:predicted ferric reductase
VAASGFGWLLLYLLVAVTPLAVALASDSPEGRSTWTEASVGLGFVGLAMLGLQFATVARFDAVNAPFGLDAVVQFHREIAYVAFAFVLAHPVILFVTDTALLELLNPVTAPWRARLGLLSVLALVALVVTSTWRTRLRISYEAWIVAHGVLALVVVVAALGHIALVGHYVDGPWMTGLWAAMSAAFVALLVNVRLVKPLRQRNRPWEVVAVEPELGGAWTFAIAPVGHAGIVFTPGQFAWIRVGRGPFSPREHPFSFSTSADRTDLVAFTISEAGDFTSTIGSVEPGTRVYLDGPFGVFSYERNEGPAFAFVAGGVGIAPVLSMLRTLADRRDPRPCLLLYANPTWDDVAHREDLDDLTSRLDLEVVHILEHPPEGWEGESGMIDEGVLRRHLPREGRDRLRVFVCGPPPMMDAVEHLLLDHGIPADHLELERFELG